MANPYDLADKAFSAVKGKDAAAWKQLAGSDLPPQDLSSEEKVRALYFQGEGTQEIAAVVRFAKNGHTALWFKIERSPQGFVIKGLQETPENPDMELNVEGF